VAEHYISENAEADIDSHWLYVANQSGSIDVANRFVDALTERFWVLAKQPYLGRNREHDLRPGLRTFAVGEHLIAIRSNSTSPS